MLRERIAMERVTLQRAENHHFPKRRETGCAARGSSFRQRTPAAALGYCHLGLEQHSIAQGLPSSLALRRLLCSGQRAGVLRVSRRLLGWKPPFWCRECVEPGGSTGQWKVMHFPACSFARRWTKDK